jgi:hypothetical protein
LITPSQVTIAQHQRLSLLFFWREEQVTKMKPSSSLLGIHALHGMEKARRDSPVSEFARSIIGCFKASKWDPVFIFGACLLGGVVTFIVICYFLQIERISKASHVRRSDEVLSTKEQTNGSDLTDESDSGGRRLIPGYQKGAVEFWTYGKGRTNEDSKSGSVRRTAEEARSTKEQEAGCYLTYQTDSGGRLMLCYQKAGSLPKNAVGFWTPGKGETIQDFKFMTGGGKSEVIRGIAGGDANRRKYFAGWCQFVKLAKAMKGTVKKFPGFGVEVDVYGFNGWESRSYLLNLEKRFVDVSNFDAVAIVPRHKDFLQGVTTMPLSTFLQKGSIAGASTMIR